MEVSSWENHMFLWAMASISMFRIGAQCLEANDRSDFVQRYPYAIKGYEKICLFSYIYIYFELIVLIKQCSYLVDTT